MGSLSPKESVVGFANSDGEEGSSTGGLQKVLKDDVGPMGGAEVRVL